MANAAISRIDKQLQALSPNSLRARVLVSLRHFRASWVELGRLLTEVAYSGSYKEWGYEEFEIYCARELGLKRPTVKKLMISYNYMKEREPQRLEALAEEDEASIPNIPDYQTVELLHRAAENGEIDTATQRDLHRQAFVGDEDEGDLRKRIREHLREPEAGEIDEANTDRHREMNDILRTARALRRKLAHARCVPAGLRDRLEQLLVELEAID